MIWDQCKTGSFFMALLLLLERLYFFSGCTVSNCKDPAGAEHPDEEQS